MTFNCPYVLYLETEREREREAGEEGKRKREGEGNSMCTQVLLMVSGIIYLGPSFYSVQR